MFAVLGNPWLWFWIGGLLLIQNAMRALPPPDPELKAGFGSSSPGYKFLYTLAQGIKGDMAAFGLDPKSLGARFMNKTNGGDSK